jgi:IS4 transposase
MFRMCRLQQLLQPIPRRQFDSLVRQHRCDCYVKAFNSWSHLTAMVFAQLMGVQGLRPLEMGFNAQRKHCYHLGVAQVRRSTLADANAQRPWQLFADVLSSLLAQLPRKLRQELQDLVYLLDSTPFTLKGRSFDHWTQPTRTLRTQGLKMHLLLGLHSGCPRWQSITAPNVNDVTEAALHLPIEPGVTYAFDKGFCDYNLWSRLNALGAYFVTRFKRNAALVVVGVLDVPQLARDTVLRDELVRFAHKSQGGGRRNHYQAVLRRVTVARPGKEPLVLATNDLRATALEIALRYKQRWLVELFFKWIKQHLNIRHFLGERPNAVKIQLLTALIAYLLLQLYRMAHDVQCTLWALLAALRTTLFDPENGSPVPPSKRPGRPRLKPETLQPGQAWEVTNYSGQ